MQKNKLRPIFKDLGKIKFKPMLRAVGDSMQLHSSAILTGIGITGMAGAVLMAITATPKALRLLEEEKNESGEEKLDKKAIVRATWKCYIPTAALMGLSIGCLIGSSAVNSRRNAALATAYSISETALKEYQGKAVELVGEKKEKEIRDAIDKDHADKVMASNPGVIITGDGETLCLDSLSGRPFKSDINKIKTAEVELGARMLDERYVSLNDFYYEIGLDPIYPLGDDLGWNIDRGRVQLSFSTQLTTDNRPCLVVNYTVAPRYDYDR